MERKEGTVYEEEQQTLFLGKRMYTFTLTCHKHK